MRVLDLFSGIGGFSLGLERAGMRTVAFCEADAKCREVLGKHWPSIPVYDDVRTLTADRLRADGIAADVICGGFPCQDISVAGKGLGLAGARSGLWREYARIIGEVRPRYVIVENVSALLGRGLGVVLGDLAALGYDAEWHCIPASALGARHRRDRLWIVAYAHSQRGHGRADEASREYGRLQQAFPAALASSKALADTDSGRGPPRQQASSPLGHGRSVGSDGRDVSDANRSRLSIRPPFGRGLAEEIGRFTRLAIERCDCEVSDADSQPQERPAKPWCEHHPWSFEPDVGRVADGVPGRVDRLKQLGNAVVPQIPEIIGRAIMSSALTCAIRGQE